MMGGFQPMMGQGMGMGGQQQMNVMGGMGMGMQTNQPQRPPGQNPFDAFGMGPQQPANNYGTAQP